MKYSWWMRRGATYRALGRRFQRGRDESRPYRRINQRAIRPVIRTRRADASAARRCAGILSRSAGCLASNNAGRYRRIAFGASGTLAFHADWSPSALGSTAPLSSAQPIVSHVGQLELHPIPSSSYYKPNPIRRIDFGAASYSATPQARRRAPLVLLDELTC